MSGQDQTLAVYDAKAQEYADRFNPAKPSSDLEAFCARLPKGARVLDLGCGPGRSAGLMAARGFVVEATDGSAEMVALASKEPGVKARQAYFEDLDADGVYDGIWANFSLLHAARGDMQSHLARISRALKPGGVFHIGMKLGEGEGPDKIGRYYVYYSEDDLRGRLGAAGLTPDWSRTGAEPGLSGEVSPFIILHATKNA